MSSDSIQMFVIDLLKKEIVLANWVPAWFLFRCTAQQVCFSHTLATFMLLYGQKVYKGDQCLWTQTAHSWILENYPYGCTQKIWI